MLTRFIKRQLVLFGILTVVALLVLGVCYLRIPTLMGIGQYQLKAEVPASGGLYPTANVTYRGITIGKVTAVEPTEKGAEATMSIDSTLSRPSDNFVMRPFCHGRDFRTEWTGEQSGQAAES